jgi:hypothetical protein
MKQKKAKQKPTPDQVAFARHSQLNPPADPGNHFQKKYNQCPMCSAWVKPGGMFLHIAMCVSGKD